MASWVTPTSPIVGSQASASWADTVAADLALLASPAYFLAGINTATAVATGANFDFTGSGAVVEDTLSGWNSTNKNYVIKSPGLYILAAEINASAFVTPTLSILKNGATFWQPPFVSGSVASTGNNFAGVYRFALNDTIAVRTSVNFTTNAVANATFLQLTQVSWV